MQKSKTIQACLSEKAFVLKEPIDGSWKGIRPYLDATGHGGILCERIRQEVKDRAARWRKISPATSFSVWFWIWGKETPSPGYVQWSVRPYLQGMGCDGTTGGVIHLIARRICSRYGLDYKKLYSKAYPGNPADWIDSLYDHTAETDSSLSLDPALAIIDLREINNHSLASLLSDLFGARGILKKEEVLIANGWARARQLAGLPPEEEKPPPTLEEQVLVYLNHPNEENWDRLAHLNTSYGTVWQRYTAYTGRELQGPTLCFGVRIKGWKPLPDPREVFASLKEEFAHECRDDD